MVVRPLLNPLILAALILIPGALAVVAVIRGGLPSQRKAETVVRVALVPLLVFVMALRPMVPNGKARKDALNVDCLFVIDTTLSMWAEDYGDTPISKKTRIGGVQDICGHMLDQMAGSSFAIITFDHRGRVLAPFTEDIRSLDDALDVIMRPTEYYAQGSSLGAPYAKMEQLLESSEKRSDRKTIVVFLSDGEITDDSEFPSYKEFSKYIDGGAVIGLGTTQGATMKDGDGWGSDNIIDPETGKDAISCIDEDNLRQIADDLGVRYVHATKPHDIDDMISRLRTEAAKTLSEREELTLYDDIYWVGAFPLAAVLGWEAWCVIRKRRL